LAGAPLSTGTPLRRIYPAKREEEGRIDLLITGKSRVKE